MIFLLELPLLLLLLPTQPVSWPLYLAAYLAGCLLLEKYIRAARPRLSFSLKTLLIALPTALALGKGFGYKDSFVWLEETLPFLRAGWFSWLLAGLCAVSLLVPMELARAALHSSGDREAADKAVPPAGDGRTGRRELLACALVALAVSSVFFQTFPLRAGTSQFDSSVFLTIGRGMREGLVPYRDMFDHKGLFLYFIEYVGILLSLPGTFSGVWFLEFLNCFAFVLLLYRLGRLVTGDRSVCLLSAAIVAAVCGGELYAGGNLCEEYALPWLSFALLVFLGYFSTGRYKKGDIFFLGLGCGAVAFIRVNMIALWVLLVPLTFVTLLVRKQFREILPCIGLFSLGLAAVCVPLLAYALATGSLDEMIRYYILFNMEYSSNGSSLRPVLNTMLALLCLCPCGVGAFVLSAFYRVKDSRQAKVLHLINFLTFSFSAYFASISGRTYYHYGTVLLPMLAIPIANALQLSRPAAEKAVNAIALRRAAPGRPGAGRRLAMGCAVLVCLLCTALNTAAGHYQADSPITGYLLSHTAPEDDVLIIDMGDPYYLQTGRFTDNKFFYQDPPLIISDGLYAEFLQEFDRKPSDTVLFTDSREVLLDGYNNNLGDFAHQMEQRLEAGEYRCEEFNDGQFCVYTKIQ